jgi:hypothetical protein
MSPASISAIAAESPERASKRARFDANASASGATAGTGHIGTNGNGYGNGYGNGNGNVGGHAAGNGLGVKLENKGRVDVTKEGNGEGVRWVLERVKIMEKQYKASLLPTCSLSFSVLGGRRSAPPHQPPLDEGHYANAESASPRRAPQTACEQDVISDISQDAVLAAALVMQHRAYSRKM